MLIDYFDGIATAGEELSHYDRVLISRITWMEVLVGAPTDALRRIREDFLRQFAVIELDEAVAREAIMLAKTMCSVWFWKLIASYQKGNRKQLVGEASRFASSKPSKARRFAYL